MPHCIIEYSRSLTQQVSEQVLVQTVHDATVESELFDVSHIKVRGLPYEAYLVDQTCDDFVHVTVRLHQGRSGAQRKELSEYIVQRLSQLSLRSVSITVETIEMDTQSYSKSVISD